MRWGSLTAEARERFASRFRPSRPVNDLWIVSRSAIPAMIGLDQDQRRQGVALRAIRLHKPGR